MGRTRSFEEPATLRAAAEAFRGAGYEGTSVDDLVTALGLHRGSLYNAYGSKRGLFLAALRHHAQDHLLRQATTTTDEDWTRALDLLLVAAVERGSVDEEVADVVRSTLDGLDDAVLSGKAAAGATPGPGLTLLADRLRQRLMHPGDHPVVPTRRSADGNDQR